MVVCCSICQERLENPCPNPTNCSNPEAAGNPCCLICGHTFHFGCVEEWLRRSGNPCGLHCPVCRKFNLPRFLNIYFEYQDDEGDGFNSESERIEGSILEECNSVLEEQCREIEKNLDSLDAEIFYIEMGIPRAKSALRRANRERDFYLEYEKRFSPKESIKSDPPADQGEKMRNPAKLRIPEARPRSTCHSRYNLRNRKR